MRQGRRWDQVEVDTLKTLVALNHSNAMISKALGRRSEAIRRKCLALGIMPKPRQRTAEAKCNLDQQTMRGLVAAAQRYKFSMLAKFLRELLVTINRDDLYVAILDLPPTKRRTVKRPIPVARPSFVPLQPMLLGSLSAIAIAGRT
jgi:hypothetical protein